jgi:glycolate oxidase
MTISITTDLAIRTAYETDASGLHLTPDAVARPSTVEEVVEILRMASRNGSAVTMAGGQTSTTGASITDKGILLSMRGLDRIIDVDVSARTARVQPGIFVGDLKRAVAEEGLLFAPDPTSEDECTVGGAIACNASGARTYRYGATRQHVRSLRVALVSGEIIEVKRSLLEKNTVGYALAHDPIDWFIGSEGTLGVIVEAELALLPRPTGVVGIAIPFPSEQSALGFIVAARESLSVSPRCLEYFDHLAFAIARQADAGSHWGNDGDSMVYIEQIFENDLDDILNAWLELAEAHGARDDLRVYSSDAELRQARKIRHAIPATMNELGAQQWSAGGRKVSTDWAVPYRRLGEAITVAREIAQRHGVEQAVIYGHAGNGHPHQNFIAHNSTELEAIERVIEETLRYIISIGGTVAAEHGIGKLKRRWLPLQMSPLQIGVMRAVKKELDPNGILSPGNIL